MSKKPCFRRGKIRGCPECLEKKGPGKDTAERMVQKLPINGLRGQMSAGREGLQGCLSPSELGPPALWGLGSSAQSLQHRNGLDGAPSAAHPQGSYLLWSAPGSAPGNGARVLPTEGPHPIHAQTPSVLVASGAPGGHGGQDPLDSGYSPPAPPSQLSAQPGIRPGLSAQEPSLEGIRQPSALGRQTGRAASTPTLKGALMSGGCVRSPRDLLVAQTAGSTSSILGPRDVCGSPGARCSGGLSSPAARREEGIWPNDTSYLRITDGFWRHAGVLAPCQGACTLSLPSRQIPPLPSWSLPWKCQVTPPAAPKTEFGLFL